MLARCNQAREESLVSLLILFQLILKLEVSLCQSQPTSMDCRIRKTKMRLVFRHFSQYNFLKSLSLCFGYLFMHIIRVDYRQYEVDPRQHRYFQSLIITSRPSSTSPQLICSSFYILCISSIHQIVKILRLSLF